MVRLAVESGSLYRVGARQLQQQQTQGKDQVGGPSEQEQIRKQPCLSTDHVPENVQSPLLVLTLRLLKTTVGVRSLYYSYFMDKIIEAQRG